MAGKTKTGLKESTAGLLCYVLGFISGSVMLVLEQENKFVKFHAIQSTLVFATLWIALMFASRVPGIGKWLFIAVFFIMFFSWILLMFKAYRGKKTKFPIAGNFVESLLLAKEKRE